jgi:hypothetical protein
MGVSATFRFRTDDVTRTLDLLESASATRGWKCKRSDDVATVSEGSQMRMRIFGGVTLADRDLPKTAVVTGMVDGDGEAGVITIEARPSAGVDNAGGRLAIQGKWENALRFWAGELAREMNMGAPTTTHSDAPEL